MEKYNKYHARLLSHCSLIPGAERLIRHLHNHGIPMAVGTSSTTQSVAIKTKSHLQLFSLIDNFVCGLDDPLVTRGKPAPDVFLACAARFPTRVDPSSCLVFEDAPNGVRAALAAGMQVVMLPDKDLVSEDDLSEATLTLGSLTEFKPELFGLPAFS